VLAVDVAAVRERHCAAAVSQLASSLQHALKPAMHIVNKVFVSNIALLASFVTLSTIQAATSQQDSFFVIFVHLALVK